MILQKMAQAIRRQDWSQIITEILIVVIGIFLGLQVQEWYEERELRAEEQIYLNKLHDEVVLMEELSTRRYGERAVIVTDLQETLDILIGPSQPTTLGQQHCLAILMSTNYQNNVGKLASISEVESNNRSMIIQNAEIRDMISDYIRLHDRWDNLTANAREGSIILPVEFPDFFLLNGEVDIRERRINQYPYSCNFDLMYESEIFKNTLHSNARSFAVIINFYGFHHDRLLALHSALDTELAITPSISILE